MHFLHQLLAYQVILLRMWVPILAENGNALVAKRRIANSVGAQNRGLWRRDDDLDGSAKPLYQQGAGRVSIIGTVCDEPGHIHVNLVQKIRQGGRITHIVLGQIRTQDVTTDKVLPKV